ncbi:hypothetical protein SSYRP_v1c05740 [Spiroplasma syrphidicola EA-1]|uniref:Uncharacterized protein n=1 Tax=Spiroplasma syrphidicola EA-1 TaxID=1276229 RepID=R4UE43_9MOLU|nr:hypothetical protein [Spiroplasma syrphidicola]AGM26164.1 hypothetical protein SSYRP_v1c05740 [Spiroplasma syrphidicola EA-1]
MAQIFERKGWLKKNNLKILHRLNKLQLSWIISRHFKPFDKKDLIIKNFVYLLRLANLNEQDYFDSIMLIKLLLIYYHLQHVKNSKVQAQGEQILKVLQDLGEKVINNKFEFNWETEIFKQNNLNNKTERYYNFHQLYSIIAQIYVQPFLQQDNYQLYYNYGYLVTFLINLTVMKKIFKDYENVDLYKIKLNVIWEYQYAIAKITPLYFNQFIQRNNYFLKKY